MLEAIRTGEDDVLVSAATGWEIAIKVQLGKLKLPEPPASFLPRALERSGFTVLGITLAHALAAGSLAPIHTDPFDRMLVAQALVEGLVLVSHDRRLSAYGVPMLST